jgi:hypothetical protein
MVVNYQAHKRIDYQTHLQKNGDAVHFRPFPRPLSFFVQRSGLAQSRRIQLKNCTQSRTFQIDLVDTSEVRLINIRRQVSVIQIGQINARYTP